MTKKGARQSGVRRRPFHLTEFLTNDIGNRAGRQGRSNSKVKHSPLFSRASSLSNSERVRSQTRLGRLTQGKIIPPKDKESSLVAQRLQPRKELGDGIRGQVGRMNFHDQSRAIAAQSLFAPFQGAQFPAFNVHAEKVNGALYLVGEGVNREGRHFYGFLVGAFGGQEGIPIGAFRLKEEGSPVLVADCR